MGSAQQYIDIFNQCRDMICKHSSALMNSKRDEAFEAFQRVGFPTKKVERYKYTDIEALFAPNYGLNLNRLDIPVNPYDAFKCDVPNMSTSLYFVVNDAFYKKALPKAELPEGVFVGSLADFSANAAFGKVSAMYCQLADDKDAITSLNTMLAQDALLIYFPKGVKVDRTLQVINILRSDVDLMVNRRVLIYLEDRADARILFCDHAADDRNFLTTQVVEVMVGDGAHLDMTCLEETHYKNVRVSNVYIHQQANSRVDHNVITLHNGVTRNRTDLVFSGEGAECYMNGCTIEDRQQHVDNNTLIDHRVPHCSSQELYKYVVDEQAVGAFAGRVPSPKSHIADRVKGDMLAASDSGQCLRLLVRVVIRSYVMGLRLSTDGRHQLNQASLLRILAENINLLTHDDVITGDFETVDQLLAHVCGGEEPFAIMSEEMNNVMNDVIGGDAI